MDGLSQPRFEMAGGAPGAGYERGYSPAVKTAVSIPDHVFAAAEKLASRLGISRSQLYTRAFSELLEKHRGDRITEALDRHYARGLSSLDPMLVRIQTASLPQDDC